MEVRWKAAGIKPPQNLSHPQQRAVGRLVRRAEGADRAVGHQVTSAAPSRWATSFRQREHDGAGMRDGLDGDAADISLG